MLLKSLIYLHLKTVWLSFQGTATDKLQSSPGLLFLLSKLWAYSPSDQRHCPPGTVENAEKLPGTKSNWVRAHLGQFLDKRYTETKKPNCHFEEAETKAEYCACLLHSMPPEGWASRLCHPSSHPLNTSPPSPRMRKLYPTQGGSKQGNLLFILTPLCCSRGSSKALPEFLVWLLVNFYWLGEARSSGC